MIFDSLFGRISAGLAVALVLTVTVEELRIARLKGAVAHAQLAQAHAETRQAQAVTRTVIRQGETTERIVTQYVAGAERVRTVTRTVVQEVPRVVTVEVDRAYGGLPVGLVRVYNASGQGVELSAVPDPAGRADSASSGVSPSTFAAAAADNNGACNEVRERAIAWAAWADAQARIH